MALRSRMYFSAGGSDSTDRMASLSVLRQATLRASHADPGHGLDASDLAELRAVASFDEYADFSWSGERLEALCRALTERMDRARRETEAAVLREKRKTAVEEWMGVVIEATLEKSESYRSARRIHGIARSAMDQDAFLVFEGD